MPKNLYMIRLQYIIEEQNEKMEVNYDYRNRKPKRKTER